MVGAGVGGVHPRSQSLRTDACLLSFSHQVRVQVQHDSLQHSQAHRVHVDRVRLPDATHLADVALIRPSGCEFRIEPRSSLHLGNGLASECVKPWPHLEARAPRQQGRPCQEDMCLQEEAAAGSGSRRLRLCEPPACSSVQAYSVMAQHKTA